MYYSVNRANVFYKQRGKCTTVGSGCNNCCGLSNQIQRLLAVDDDNPEQEVPSDARTDDNLICLKYSYMHAEFEFQKFVFQN